MCPEITGQVQCRTTLPKLVNASLNALAGNWFLLLRHDQASPRPSLIQSRVKSVVECSLWTKQHLKHDALSC